ncbi:MAG TPA: branched-chain amino acid ABC transporter permease [Chloroflexota bacterium]|jgi:branched-chain amino acid transport system permease protein
MAPIPVARMSVPPGRVGARPAAAEPAAPDRAATPVPARAPAARPWGQPLAVLALFLVVAAVPWLSAEPYVVLVLMTTTIYVAMSIGWNIIGGFAGQVSFGHAAFYGIGAYTTTLLLLRLKDATGLDVPPAVLMVLSLPLAGLLAAVFAVLIGIPTLRLRGPFFSIATIGVGEAVRLVALYAEPLTGGGFGLSLPISFGELRLVSYYVAAVWMALSILGAWWVERSKFGLGLAAIRLDEDAAQTLGVDTPRYKVLALALSAFVVGVAGGIYATTQFYLAPDSVFAFSLSITMILMPIVGGVGTLWGPVLGAVVYVLLREQVIAYRPNDHLFIFGFLLIFIMLFEPGGIVGAARRVARRLRR